MLDWLEKQPFCAGRKEAVALCRKLQKLGAIVHVWGSQKFKFTDTTMFFRFSTIANASLLSLRLTCLPSLQELEFLGEIKTAGENYQRLTKEQTCSIGEDNGEEFDEAMSPSEISTRSVEHYDAIAPPSLPGMFVR